MYENFPFWATFFKELRLPRDAVPTVQPARSTSWASRSIPSESECYPAKLAHGHISWLIKQGCDVYLLSVYSLRAERGSGSAGNHYNCPMVTSYSENIKNNMEELKAENVKFLNPFMAFTSEAVLSKQLQEVFKKEFDIPESET